MENYETNKAPVKVVVEIEGLIYIWKSDAQGIEKRELTKTT